MKKTFIVKNTDGLHYRPASLIVEIAQQAPCSLKLIKEGKTANPASMMSILKLGVKYGEAITIETEGDHAESILDAIGRIIETNEE
ncbi:hypothetical protein BK133_20050 [Paenibacillus sp. FSL H8-0548]|uniref:HPr family phosphocarrier protein n=1 Tax=Paenibacillus sp. FSL H8-0548 TaxID=1920422 RepID=UPI00096C44CA|nr:HPr family phosphocarrier protein [Paenibacillus sp. FSL H8-0548]OMF26734.1 hypothetical protein BK133_20050 [Paenibacillus sp. FSL H8-0548]